jgi:SAM-dependent methyltransferase
MNVETFVLSNDDDQRQRDLIEHRKATEALSRGNVVEAFDILSRLASEGSPCWEVFNDLGAIAMMNGDLEAAELMLREATSRDAPVSVHMHLATALAFAQKYEDALAQLSAVLRNEASNADALSLVREILGKAGTLTPVAWAKLIADLRLPAPEIRKKLDLLDDTLAENRRLKQVNERLSNSVQRYQANFAVGRSKPESLAKVWRENFRTTTEEQWLDVLLRSVDEPLCDGFPMPGFPPEGIQIGMVGSSNQAALQEGFRFYKVVREICTKSGAVWDEESHLLDFGTGWGRYARIFARDFNPNNIVGIDVDPTFVDLCQKTFPFGDFRITPAFPPCDLPDNQFDLIVAYSVFSHLSEQAANAWVGEFARVLKPGAIAAFTTQGRNFIRVCEQHRQTKQHTHPWHMKLAASFLDAEAAERDYDDGRFLFSATGAGEHRSSEFYGEAMIPKKYVLDNWSDRFELVEYLQPTPLPQALIVLKKRS